MYTYRKFYVHRRSHICATVIVESSFDKLILWMGVIVWFHNLSKDWKPKSSDNCQTGREQAPISFIAMAAEPWPGEEILYFCSLSFSSQVVAE